MLSLPRFVIRPHPKRAFRRRQRPAVPTLYRKGRCGATGHLQELWHVALYLAVFTLLCSTNQPRWRDTLGRRSEGLPVLIGAVTAGLISGVVLRALADEFEERFEPVIPAPREKPRPRSRRST